MLFACLAKLNRMPLQQKRSPGGGRFSVATPTLRKRLTHNEYLCVQNSYKKANKILCCV